MPAGKLDLVIEQGATWRQSLQYLQANGTPFDLTGYDVRMQARRNHSSDVILFFIDTAAGYITVDTSTATITLEIPANQTAAFQWSRAVYDIEIEDTVGSQGVARIVEGVITLSREVTR